MHAQANNEVYIFERRRRAKPVCAQELDSWKGRRGSDGEARTENKKDDECYENEREEDGEEALEVCLVCDSEVEVTDLVNLEGVVSRKEAEEGRRVKGEAKFNGVPTTGPG